jgi:hypothetical protein
LEPVLPAFIFSNGWAWPIAKVILNRAFGPISVGNYLSLRFQVFQKETTQSGVAKLTPVS